MLPTYGKSEIYLLHEKLNFSLHGEISQNDGDKEPQHLYIVSDEDSNEGDWIIDTRLLQFGKIERVLKTRRAENAITTEKGKVLYADQFKKIIASTDPQLTLCTNSDHEEICTCSKLPQISQAFITLYIEEYNAGRKIEKVEVEYTRFVKGYFDGPNASHSCSENYTSQGKKFYQCCGNIYWEDDMRDLKISEFSFVNTNKNNTINIKSLKDSWTREEVERISYEAYKVGIQQGIGPSPKPFTEWIKENL